MSDKKIAFVPVNNGDIKAEEVVMLTCSDEGVWVTTRDGNLRLTTLCVERVLTIVGRMNFATIMLRRGTAFVRQEAVSEVRDAKCGSEMKFPGQNPINTLHSREELRDLLGWK